LILRDLLACGAEVHVVSRTVAALERALALGAHSAKSDISALNEIDGFIVATPTATHAGVLERLVPTGRPVFVEKPMTADADSARRLAAAAEGRLFVMDKWRYHPGIQAMRTEIDSGRVGEVLALRTVRWGWGNPHSDVSALWILAPHDLAVVLHLTGTIPDVRGAFPASTREPGLGVTAHLGTGGGPCITLDIGIASPEHRRRCLVIGSRATLELRDGYDERIFVRDGAPGATGAPERTIDAGTQMPLLAELQAFLAFLAGGPAPMSTAREGLLIVERLAAIEAAVSLALAPGR
jgi:predicted dehydrogenase